jgi:hypothetical protein
MDKRQNKTLIALPVICGLTAFALAPTTANAVVISPSNMGDWAFVHRDASGTQDSSANGIGQMVNGPATPPAGTGSAQLATGNGTAHGDGDQDLRNTAYAGVALSTITALSYSTYTTANNGQQFPFLALDVNWSGDVNGGYSDRIFFEPPYQQPSTGEPGTTDQGATALNTWQNWVAKDSANASTGSWWSNAGGACSPGSNACTLADYIALHPLAVIINTDTGLGGLEFRVGQAGAGDIFNGYVDNFTIGINGVNTTYDFEAAAAGAVPLPAALPLLGSGLGVMGLLGWRKKRKRTARALA